MTLQGLNRTSVGLKLTAIKIGLSGKYRPQSNQRGIETCSMLSQSNAQERPQSNQRGIETIYKGKLYYRRMCLNRTSVGLKR